MHAIWKDRYFRRYFAAFTIGNIGDWFAFLRYNFMSCIPGTVQP